MSFLPTTKTYSNIDDRVWVVIRHLTKPHLVLLGQRSAQCNNPGTYGFFGGHVDKGEQLLTAAARELKEETSLVVPIRGLFLIKDRHRKGAHNFWFEAPSLFTTRLDGLLTTPEVSKYIWYDTQALSAYDRGLNDEALDLHFSIKQFLKG